MIYLNNPYAFFLKKVKSYSVQFISNNVDNNAIYHFYEAQIHLALIKGTVCVLMTTHCSNMCFRFHTTCIDGISVVYFRFMQLLGRPRYIGGCVSVFVY